MKRANEKKRKENEKKFTDWKEIKNGGRIYWLEIKGRLNWKVKYVKEVDENENTVRFYQEIYNEDGKLVEIHHKFPVDKGHQKL